MRDNERGFMTYERTEAGYRPRDQRLRDFRGVERSMPDDELNRQLARCMDCGIPFCHASGCPVRNLIPEFNDAAYHGKWRDALELLRNGCCFPEFTGRVCPAPCEAACVLGINREPVAIRLIELAVIEKGFERGYMEPRVPAVRFPERVAVVGSGPAGLAVADVLNRKGFNVVVYENEPHAGGILRYGIPDFKLEKWVVERRVELMKAEGVVFETGVEVGHDISHRYLHDRFDAIVLTGGAREPRDLKVPGRELDGVHFAMDFLIQQNRLLGGEPVRDADRISAAGKDVVVIGGGDTGSDCVGTSLRQGARSVLQIEIMPRPPDARSESTPWPMWPYMLRESSSHKEGGQRRWSVSTESFSGSDGRVERLQCAEVEWERQDNGRQAPRRRDGSDFGVDAQLVLLAMGFVGPGPNQLVEDLGLALDSRGFVERDAAGMTSVKGVFVAGDMSQGASLVVRAIQNGKETAAGVEAYLRRRREDRGVV